MAHQPSPFPLKPPQTPSVKQQTPTARQTDSIRFEIAPLIFVIQIAFSCVTRVPATENDGDTGTIRFDRFMYLSFRDYQADKTTAPSRSQEY